MLEAKTLLIKRLLLAVLPRTQQHSRPAPSPQRTSGLRLKPEVPETAGRQGQLRNFTAPIRAWKLNKLKS